MGGNHDFDFLGNQNHFFGNQNHNQNHLNFGNQNHRSFDEWKSIKIKIIFGNQNQNHRIFGHGNQSKSKSFWKSKS